MTARYSRRKTTDGRACIAAEGLVGNGRVRDPPWPDLQSTLQRSSPSRKTQSLGGCNGISVAPHLPPLIRRELCIIRKKNNRSGVSGISHVDRWEKKRGRLYRRIYWDAQWPIENGKARHKKFSVKKYGDVVRFYEPAESERKL